MTKTAKDPADYILPLYMNGLEGRMLRLPPPKNRKREILFVYGHHASLERYFGFAEELNKYGGITMPDLPGFGGMEPFYKIGKKPTLDNLADYLASFIKLRYKGRRLTIMGFSLGFVVVTRMLQKYPDISKKVDILVSVAGFVHKDDLKFKKRNRAWIHPALAILKRRVPAFAVQHIAFSAPAVRLTYKLNHRNLSKFQGVDEDDYKRLVDFEVHLWRCNEARTYFSTAQIMLTLVPLKKHVDLPVYHVAIDDDRYFNNLLVEEHMRAIFADFRLIKAKLPTHMPSVIASAKEAAPFIPKEARALLRRKVQ